MTADQKLIFFCLLVKWRFKEIKITYSSTSDTNFSFIRYLIENIEILDDVWIQVSTIVKSLGYVCWSRFWLQLAMISSKYHSKQLLVQGMSSCTCITPFVLCSKRSSSITQRNRQLSWPLDIPNSSASLLINTLHHTAWNSIMSTARRHLPRQNWSFLSKFARLLRPHGVRLGQALTASSSTFLPLLKLLLLTTMLIR